MWRHSSWRLQLHSGLRRFVLISHSGDVLYLPQLEHRKNYSDWKKLGTSKQSRAVLFGVWRVFGHAFSSLLLLTPLMLLWYFPQELGGACVQVIVTYMTGTLYKDCRRRDPRFITFTLSVHTSSGSGSAVCGATVSPKGQRGICTAAVQSWRWKSASNIHSVFFDLSAPQRAFHSGEKDDAHS